jgi:hypothetical protein
VQGAVEVAGSSVPRSCCCNDFTTDLVPNNIQLTHTGGEASLRGCKRKVVDYRLMTAGIGGKVSVSHSVSLSSLSVCLSLSLPLTLSRSLSLFLSLSLSLSLFTSSQSIYLSALSVSLSLSLSHTHTVGDAAEYNGSFVMKSGMENRQRESWDDDVY